MLRLYNEYIVLYDDAGLKIASLFINDFDFYSSKSFIRAGSIYLSPIVVKPRTEK